MISNWFTPQILGPTRITEHQKESLLIIYLLTSVIYIV